MSSLVEEALEVLYAAKVPLAPGLSPWQLEDVEEQFSFEFSPDHARFLSLAMPIGPGWVDWLGDPVGIQKRLDWPRDGVLFDVRESAFWPEEWASGQPKLRKPSQRHVSDCARCLSSSRSIRTVSCPQLLHSPAARFFPCIKLM
ncbi:hypothetical protein [Paenarthrobacter nicotinovorans]|uniref:hypothetical protein n=1 Tax=Paenarthrobacter nicotinovorans TaxID=29320 RepID=UPI003D664441